MKLKEFLDKIGVSSLYVIGKAEYELQIQHNENFAFDYHETTKMNCIEIDDTQKTITLKYQYREVK